MSRLRKAIESIHKGDWTCVGHSEGLPCCLEDDETTNSIIDALIEALPEAYDREQSIEDMNIGRASYRNQMITLLNSAKESN